MRKLTSAVVVFAWCCALLLAPLGAAATGPLPNPLTSAGADAVIFSPSGLTSVVVTAISAGEVHSCALTSSGGVKCWGSNSNGQLGDGSLTSRSVPVDVSGLQGGVAALSAGSSSFHTCALTSAGGVKCWGQNTYGQLGDGTATRRLAPVDVTGLPGSVVAIATGSEHTCALTTGGAVKCWGWNTYGQLGDNSATTRVTPVNVTGLQSGVTAIAAGLGQTCAVTSGGAATCWGYNYDGELGDGTTTNRAAPVAVIGLQNGVAALSAGSFHTCVLTSGGGAKYWGNNASGQLGDGTTTTRHTPVNVSGLQTGAASVEAGGGHNCAVTTAGGARCWGNNDDGELGDGTTTGRPIPVDVVGLQNGVAGISAGATHTCAFTAAGVARCWGWNHNGELGDGTLVNRPTPVVVAFPGDPTPTATRTASATATVTRSSTPTRTWTRTPTRTPSLTRTLTRTLTATSTATMSRTPTRTRTLTRTATHTPTITPGGPTVTGTRTPVSRLALPVIVSN